MRARTLLLALVLTSACTALQHKPDVYESKKVPVQLPQGELPLTIVKPVRPTSPDLMILYATGDAGWLGAAKVIFRHLVDRGFNVAAYNSQRVVSSLKKAKEPPTFEQTATRVDTVLTEAKKALGLPESTRVIIVGFSRGANLVAFAGGEPSLQRHLAGGIALALTAESDYVKAPDPRPAWMQLDEKGRIKTYPALSRFGKIPIAVIQSAGDSYVPADESRKLFGPDTDTRRLYEVNASSHGFGGGREEMLKDLDEALGWMMSLSSSRK